MKRAILLLFIAMLILFSGCPEPPVPDNGGGAFPPVQKAKWTILIFLDADNNLEPASVLEVDEMEKIGSTEDVKILVQWDRIEGYDESNGDWTGTKRFLVTQDSEEGVIASQELMDLGELNMAKEETLYDFIVWGMQNYPSERYALVLWDHGGGWTMQTEDSTSGEMADIETAVRALQRASDTTGVQKIDLIVFDQCLMGQIDVMDAIADYGKVLVASQDVVPFFSFPYDVFLEKLAANPGMDEKEFAKNIVDSYGEFYTDTMPNPYVTMAALDLSKMPELKQSFVAFTEKLNENVSQHWPEIGESLFYSESFAVPEGLLTVKTLSVNDLSDFADIARQQVGDTELDAAAKKLQELIEGAVIAEFNGKEHKFAKGLTIYFPDDETVYRPQYPVKSNFGVETGWDDFLKNYAAAEKTDTIAPSIVIDSVSASTTSMQNPVEISATITGNNIVSFYRVIGEVQGDNVYIFLSAPLEYVEKKQYEGREIPDFVDGANPISYKWTPKVRVLTNGAEQVIAPLQPFRSNGYYYLTNGEYVTADGKQTFDAIIIFDLRYGSILGALQVIEAGGDITSQKEFLPQPGDKFTPYIEVYSMSTGILSLAKTGQIEFSENLIWADYVLLDKGQYSVGLFVQDVTGNTAGNFIGVNVIDVPDARPDITLNDVVGKWEGGGYGLEIKEDGTSISSSGGYAKEGAYWFRNRNGQPLITLYSSTDDTMLITFLIDVRENALLLTEIFEGDEYTLWKEGTTPPELPPVGGEIDGTLISKWDNQYGYVEFREDKSYVWEVSGTTVSGTFETANGKLYTSSKGQTVEYNYSVSGSTLTVSDNEGATLTYTKSSGQQPQQPAATGLVGSWYNSFANDTTTFNADGSYQSYISGNLFASGTYSTSENVLILSSNYGVYQYIFEVNGNLLSIYNPFYGTLVYYVRVS